MTALKPKGAGAVMASRKEPHDSLEYFPTPLWATRALCEWLKERDPISELTVWEPACGEGHMARPLAEYFARVEASDVHDYGYGEVEDYLFCRERVVDYVITNPPFRLAEQFIRASFTRARVGVAMLVRTSFLDSVGRYNELFSLCPPSDILQFSERVPMHKGKLTATGTTATAYCWICFRHKAPRTTQFHWLAPCRKRLERPGDYEAHP